MSLTSLNNDLCTYKHNIEQSMNTGNYMTGAPRLECTACFNPDPMYRIGSGFSGGTGGKFGVSTCENKSLIDVSSELLNITRKASNCPADKFTPPKNVCNTIDLVDCKSIKSEDTRFSNPPNTLKGTGWNRWEWLCKNPQDNVIQTFSHNISNRIIVKDNHRPCIPKPINQAVAVPPMNNSDDVYSSYKNNSETIDSTDPTDPTIPSIHWRKQSEYEKYY